MPNVDAPNGLRAVGTLGSAGYVGRVQAYQTSTSDTQAICVGDPVVRGTALTNGLPTATRLTTGGTSAILGVVVGVAPNPADLSATFRKASSNTQVFVDTDPNTIYEVADSSATQTTYLTTTTVTTALQQGYNYLLTMSTVDTTTGNGKVVLGTTVGTTTTMHVRVLGLSPKVGNELGAYAKYLVLINNHANRSPMP